MAKKKKYKLEIDNRYPKSVPKYFDTLSEAKQYIRDKRMYADEIARIRQLKADGKSYKAVSSHWWAKSNKTGRDRIVGL